MHIYCDIFWMKLKMDEFDCIFLWFPFREVGKCIASEEKTNGQLNNENRFACRSYLHNLAHRQRHGQHRVY